MRRRIDVSVSPPGRFFWHGRWRRVRSKLRAAYAALRQPTFTLAGDDMRAFGASIDHALEHLLPVVGPVFGAVVILFAAWDYWVDAAHAALTLRIRLALVLVGALGYLPGRLNWSVARRCAYIYATHTGAMVLAAALLDGGLVLALPGITASMFPLVLVEPRLRRCLAVVLPHSLLLAGLAFWTLPPKIFLNSMLLYALSLLLAAAVALAQGRLRRAAFLTEKQLQFAVRHDSLSGALSRSHLAETAARDLMLARRHAHPLAVALLDIDHFKQINDCYGHAIGDLAIRALVDTCRQAMRGSDYIGRVGGEEFVCVMPETDTADALACAERIRALVAALSLPIPGASVSFTVSLGVCMLDRDHPDWAALLRGADAAMYTAKSSGRNRVVLASPAGP